jgi:hypothetical protein
MLFRSENPILGPKSKIIWADGTIHYLVAQGNPAFASSAPSNPRGEDVEPTISGTSVAVTGAAVAIRGNLTVATGSTVTSGFLYGTQGKLTVKGAISSANFHAGLVGQLDLSAATLTSPGPISAIWGDMGASMSASAITGAADLSILHLTNTAPGATINSAIFVEALATYLLDISNASYSPFFSLTAPGAAYGRIAIKTTGGTKYIGVYSA